MVENGTRNDLMVVTLVIGMAVFVGFFINSLYELTDHAEITMSEIGNDLVANISKIGQNSVNNSENTRGVITNTSQVEQDKLDSIYNVLVSNSQSNEEQTNLLNQINTKLDNVSAILLNKTSGPPVIIIPTPPIINNTNPSNNTNPDGNNNTSPTNPDAYLQTICNIAPKAEVCSGLRS